MSSNATLDQQIDYMERHIKKMKKILPQQVNDGKISDERSIQILSSASSILQTLTQLRGITRIGEM